MVVGGPVMTHLRGKLGGDPRTSSQVIVGEAMQNILVVRSNCIKIWSAPKVQSAST